MNKDDLIQLAKNNDIDVAARWSKTDIIDALNKAGIDTPEAYTQAETPKDDKTAPILLYSDYWDDEGTRHLKGTVIKVDVATAKTLIKEEKAERADPLPGEFDQRENG